MNNNSKNNGTVDGEKTRRKRLKVVSACGECRRKKTKCNGEKPCAGCLKARVECKYVYQKPNGLGVFTAAATVTVAKPVKKLSSSNSTTMTEMMNDGNSKINMKSSPQPMPPPSSSSSLSISTSTHSPPLSTTSSSTISIEAIEERLGAIENILRTLLGSSKNKHFLHGLQHPQPQPPQQALCGDMYTSTSPYLVHAPPIQNRSLPREKRKRHDIDGEGVTDSSINNKRVFVREDIGHGYHQRLQLAPIKILNHSPATPTIRNLLNTEEMDEKRWYPSSSVQQQTTPPPPTHHTSSAFYRMSSSTNNNSATTAAGSLS